MQNFLAISKALSDEGRVRAIMALSGGELCLCQIIELLGVSPSTVSKHMSILQAAGLIQSRKEGRWRYYRLAGRDAPPVVREALRWLQRSLEHEPTIARDLATLCCVRDMDLKELSACYNAK